jgi:hypothetical protein
MLACCGTLIFQCTPINAAWDHSVKMKPTTTCFSNDTFSDLGLWNSVTNCVTDALFALLPIPIILRLQVNFRTKVMLAAILSLGYTACAAGIVKAITQYTFFKKKDPFWHNSFSVWNMIELCVGITAASLPALKPLVSHGLSVTRSLLGKSSRMKRSQSRFYGRSSDVHEQDREGQDIVLEDRKSAMHTDTLHGSTLVDSESYRKDSVPRTGRPSTAAGSLTLSEVESREDFSFARSQSDERLHSPGRDPWQREALSSMHSERRKDLKIMN